MNSRARWLLWLGLGVLLTGALAAVVVRWRLPGVLLRVGFFADPAGVVAAAAGLLALGLLAAAGLARWHARRLRQALAEQAAALEQERRRFIQRLDHELKNPLTAIQVHLDNLQADHANGAPPGEAVADVRAQVGRLAQLTRGLRRLADLETRPLEIETVEVAELLDEVVELLDQPDRIRLEVQRAPWPIPPIQADRELLLMVFRNLADNALKYSAAPVDVRARDTAGHLLVDIVDTGRGIPSGEQPLVTGELYRGSNTRDVPGSGLGLAIVQRIIERHGGRLELRSREGQGSIATVTLPYEPAARG
jgi:two-component system OmpR family sensor kinase